jgi:primosomal protein N' (replication factor Y)
LVSGGNKHATESFARRLAAVAPRSDDAKVLGPAEAPLALIRGRHRYRLMVKSARNFDLPGYLRGWLALAPKRKGDLKLDVDVDPQSFL